MIEAVANVEEEEVSEGFQVKDLETADWALRRIADYKAEMAENERVAEANILREKLRLERLNKRPEAMVDFFSSHLRLFAELARSDLLKGGKAKSRKLSHGSIGWRSKPDRLEVRDAAALVAWAEGLISPIPLVRTKKEPAMVPIKELFDRTGEIPPGTEVVPGCEEFYVKTEASNGNE